VVNVVEIKRIEVVEKVGIEVVDTDGQVKGKKRGKKKKKKKKERKENEETE